MWEKISKNLLQYRWVYFPLLLVATAFMAYQATKIELSYAFAKLIPQSDPVYQNNMKFKELFGEDGNVLMIGVKSEAVFQKDFFNDWYRMGNAIKETEGITDVISIAHIYNLKKNDSLQKLDFTPIMTKQATSQEEVDSLKKVILGLPFYDGLIFNADSNVSAMAVTFNPEMLNSKGRDAVVEKIKELTDAFSTAHNVTVHRSGLPFIRTVVSVKIKDELVFFVQLSMLITAILLFIMFRSIYMVIFPMIVVMFGVVWSLGLIGLFGYKITLLTGLIPPLIIVIGIPNCIYLLNRYHSEFLKRGDKVKSLQKVVEKVGVATLFTNLTTAIGFGVFFATDSSLLKEFGSVAGLSIMTTFVVSLIFIPIVFSFLPKPTKPQMKYLDNKHMEQFIEFIAERVLKGRKIIFAISLIVVSVASIGLMKIRAESFIVDDIPHDSQEFIDLKFFEKYFNGIMPLEIVIDGKKAKKGASYTTMKKMEKAHKAIAKYPEFSTVISIAQGLKFVNQAYYGGNPRSYRVPKSNEAKFLKPYLESEEESNASQDLINNFRDTTGQYSRLSLRVQDIGSQRLPVLIDSLNADLLKIFKPKKFNLMLTGTSITFIAGNKYLTESLVQSLILAFILIAFIMVVLFRSGRMLFICLVPNTIPLIVTAGLMGFFDIALKPSTVLVFSVAYGIAVDTSIHFLAKFQQEIQRHNWDTQKTITVALKETGRSMIYNSLILFCGFIIFSGSSFGGTVALGILTSITLIVAMLTNTILLPSLLMLIEGTIKKKGVRLRAIRQSKISK